MLGVLAIIGVLSIVSISAYSQAMFKHQLNQHLESFSLFLNNAISLLPELQRTATNGVVTLSKFFNDTSMLPNGMNYYPGNNSVKDVFKNSMQIFYAVTAKTDEYYLSIVIDRDDEKISSRAKAICRNVLIAAKENVANIWAVGMRSGNSNDDGYSQSDLGGGTYNFGGRPKRLADAGLTDFEDVCSSCSSQRYCSIILYISVVKK